MGFFLVKSPLAVAVGAALAQLGDIIELPDEEGAHLVANGTVEPSIEGPTEEPAPARRAKAKE